jgi:cephalosporin hydroxylase
MPKLNFTNEWFNDSAKDVWDKAIPILNPKKILEIGSYEGASACYLISKLTNIHSIELHCIDSWKGGAEHKNVIDMKKVYSRFKKNINLTISQTSKTVDLKVHKGLSNIMLPKLLNENGLGYFDLIYIDGSHQATDVITDAIMSFLLLKVGGYIIFDDYLWKFNSGSKLDSQILNCPKIAIDSFCNVFFDKIEIIPYSTRQVFVKKTKD